MVSKSKFKQLSMASALLIYAFKLLIACDNVVKKDNMKTYNKVRCNKVV